VEPDFNLNIMKESQTLSAINSKILIEFSNVILTAKIDIVLVHGYTSTIFSASLISYYKQVKIAHLEVGLRIDNK